MRVLGVIPARLGSTRLPNKPLQLLAGEPLITRVIQHVVDLGLVEQLVVATDSQMIAQVVERAGVRAVLTHDGHLAGTDRVAEAAGRAEFAGFDVVANVQGDEPFLPREALAGAIDRVAQGDDIGTAAAPLPPEHAADPSRVKVVTDARGRALYFSRAAIPRRREATDPADGLYWQHLGLYVYTRPALAALGGRAAEPGRAGRAPGAAPRAALRSHDRRGPADRARAARRGHAGRSSTGGSPLARTTGVAI